MESVEFKMENTEFRKNKTEFKKKIKCIPQDPMKLINLVLLISIIQTCFLITELKWSPEKIKWKKNWNPEIWEISDMSNVCSYILVIFDILASFSGCISTALL